MSNLDCQIYNSCAHKVRKIKNSHFVLKFKFNFKADTSCLEKL